MTLAIYFKGIWRGGQQTRDRPCPIPRHAHRHPVHRADRHGHAPARTSLAAQQEVQTSVHPVRGTLRSLHISYVLLTRAGIERACRGTPFIRSGFGGRSVAGSDGSDGCTALAMTVEGGESHLAQADGLRRHFHHFIVADELNRFFQRHRDYRCENDSFVFV